MRTKTSGRSVSDSVSWRVVSVLRKAASKKFSAFTLVELIVVITILAILAAIGFLALSGYTQEAKDSSVKANVRSVITAIASESALTGNSPRHYVVHDAGASLANGTVAYVDGNPVSLTGGQYGTAGTNYSAWNPDWTKLRLNPDKFRLSSLGSRLAAAFGTAEAVYDPKLVSVGAVDAVLALTANGRSRSVSYFQAAGTAPSGNVTVLGTFPSPTGAQTASGAAAGLIKDSAGTSSSGALVDGSASSGIPAPTPAYCGGFLLRENQAMKVYLNVDEACVDADSWKASTKQTLAWIWGSYDRYGILDPWGELSNTNNDHGYFWINNGSQDYFEIYNNQWKKYFWMWKESGAFNFKAAYLDSSLPSNRMFVTFSQPQANTGFEYYFGEYGEWPMIVTDASGAAQNKDTNNLWTPYTWAPIPSSVSNVYVEYVKVCPIWQQLNKDGTCGPYACNSNTLSNFPNVETVIAWTPTWPYSGLQWYNSSSACYLQCKTGFSWMWNGLESKMWCYQNSCNPNKPAWTSEAYWDYVVWSPYSLNQAWQNTDPYGACYYVCKNWPQYYWENCDQRKYAVSWNFWYLWHQSTINVCWVNYTTLYSDWSFNVLRNAWSDCSNITATKFWFLCTVNVQGPSSLQSDINNISWSCFDLMYWDLPWEMPYIRYIRLSSEYSFYQPGTYWSAAWWTSVVNDLTTWLQWQSAVWSTSAWMSWTSAKTYCSDLVLWWFADWRLPDITELSSIIQPVYNWTPMFVDGYLQNNTDPGFWSSTINAENTSDALGYSIWSYQYWSKPWIRWRWHTSFNSLVRCVRWKSNKLPWQWVKSGYYDASHHVWTSAIWESRFSVTGWWDFVYDNVTKLNWQKNWLASWVISWSQTWWRNQSISYCDNLVLWWFSDWRVPNIKELSSIIDFWKNDWNSYWYDSYFQSSNQYGYISRTQDNFNSINTNVVKYNSSWIFTNALQDTDTYYVRCVR